MKLPVALALLLPLPRGVAGADDGAPRGLRGGDLSPATPRMLSGAGCGADGQGTEITIAAHPLDAGDSFGWQVYDDDDQFESGFVAFFRADPGTEEMYSYHLENGGHDGRMSEGGCASDPENCGCDDVFKRDYHGTIATTVSGSECQPWSGWEHNYCRNPFGQSSGPVCPTLIGEQSCDVPSCPTWIERTICVPTNHYLRMLFHNSRYTIQTVEGSTEGGAASKAALGVTIPSFKVLKNP